ncbi:DNA polymerase III subunit gamma/tau [Henriciella mobilis]|uniref:DNA polymerase III subunit gamma/tau n=1 Tax=Henriciella mobilis TaxID=2305467 RepID=UPI000E665B5F|nr:DNA polymerase III subunit gamma/tau [Henriciella mobilis]RIJ16222.1 DNA polymerase III subunit gamma/tau [Henriciella mobilis]RIJ22870.1 DNA polymerase III subunit gamma/tau [Henriciella mobilis]
MSDESLNEPEGERDDATFSMFGEEEMGSAEAKAPYQVLARKYRPKLFSDLIGQEAMVRTLRNAFETGRIAHAFMLTGVRGVGKTTTARLLARAFNYEGADHDGPSLKLDPPGEHCKAIMESRHPDVLELDAASRTGVADMRDLLDGVRYSPQAARYKVYIIDEVHMLSTASFNALLKTLEEPPPHVKFIFATTEIRKVPVTVLSRCQRFDLKRLETAELAAHLAKIAAREGAKISEEGITLIARAAEGSVRDGLSILDQAIVQGLDGGEISGEAVRDMLGLGDRLRLLDVFEYAVTGKAQEAVSEITDQIQIGADPLVLMKDLLEIAADVATVQAMGDNYTLPGPADWTNRTKQIADSVTPAQAQRNWQILLSGYRDTQSAPETDVALRMVILRLVSAAGLPSPEDAARMIAEGGGSASSARGKGGKEDPNVVPVGGGGTGQLSKFEDVLDLLEKERQPTLWGQAKAYIRPAVFADGTISCDLKDGAPVDLLRRLTDFLEVSTGRVWDVQKAKTNRETVKEREERLKNERIEAVRSDPDVRAALAAIPGAEIVEVSDPQPLEATGTEDNVVPLRVASHKKG